MVSIYWPRYEARRRGVSVLTFLEGEVNNASYILACSADAIVASDSVQVYQPHTSL